MPLDPEDISRLRDVISYAGKFQAMVDGLSQASFMSDTKTFVAVCYDLQVVGEAAWKLSDGMKKSQTTIPSPLIAGMREVGMSLSRAPTARPEGSPGQRPGWTVQTNEGLKARLNPRSTRKTTVQVTQGIALGYL